MTVNKAILVGNLGQDPELRTTASGTAVCTLRLATTTRIKRGDTWEDATEWHSVVTFGRTAENAAQHLAKGRQVYVEGRIQTRKWQDSEGKDRYSTEIVADTLRFLGGGNRSEGGSRPAPDSRERTPPRGGGGSGAASQPAGDDDFGSMPF